MIRLSSEGTWSDWTGRKLRKFPLDLASSVIYAPSRISTTFMSAYRGVRGNNRQDGLSTSGQEAGFFSAWLICFVATLLVSPAPYAASILLSVGFVKLVLDLFERLRTLLREEIAYSCLLTRKDVQHPPRSVFAITAGLQILDLCVLTLSADFESPLKGWRKCDCGTSIRPFLAGFLKLKSLQCSNPVDEETATTHMICTNGKLLDASRFGLSPCAVSGKSRSSGDVSHLQEDLSALDSQGKVSAEGITVQTSGRKGKPAIGAKFGCLLERFRSSLQAPCRSRRRLTVAVRGGAKYRCWDISVTCRSRRPQFLFWPSRSPSLRKEMLEYIAQHPEVCFVKEVRGFHG